MERELTILLVEDDTQACEEIVSYVDELDDVTIVDITNNAPKAVKSVHDYLPDAVILDLELHGGGGNGLFFLRAIHDDPPAKTPYVLITTNNSSAITYEAARQSGADYIFSKHQEGYSAKEVIDFLRMLKGVIQNRPQKAQNATDGESPAQKNKRITRRICTELDRVGISVKAKGYQYLIDAIIMTMNEPTPNTCGKIAEKCGKTDSSVERAMQNAINRAWRTTPIDELLEAYTAKISSDKGVPTLTEFVYHYANKIKQEY